MKTHILFFLIISLPLAAQFQNVKINSQNPRPNEVTVAINPVNPQIVVAGSNTRSVYYSSDGGKNWSESTLPQETMGDPSIVFDAQGRAYYAHLSTTYESIKVRFSDDGGKTWSKSFGIRGPSSDSAKGGGSYYKSSLQDKEWLAVDMTNSAYRGNVYASWTDFSKYGSRSPNDSSVIAFARSTNRGVSFEPFVRVSDEIGNAVDSDSTMEGAVPAVGSQGEIYIAWSGPRGLYFDRSLDGGRTFGKDKLLTATPGGWDFPISGISRCNGLPITACDISNSPHRGTIYVNWIDHRNGDPDVFIIKSTDTGISWSPVIRVNNDPARNGKAQFFTWMSVDPITGEVSLVYYDRRNYVGDSTDVYLARSTDGGNTFLNTKISDAAFYPTAGIFFGDYSGIASYDGMIRPIWTEINDGVQSIHTALIQSISTSARDLVLPKSVELLQNYPNPFSAGLSRSTIPSFTTIEYNLPQATSVRLSVHDLLGREVKVVVDAMQAAGKHQVVLQGKELLAGTYIYRLQTPAASLSRMMTCWK